MNFIYVLKRDPYTNGKRLSKKFVRYKVHLVDNIRICEIKEGNGMLFQLNGLF